MLVTWCERLIEAVVANAVVVGRCRCRIEVSVIWCCRGGLLLWGRRLGWRRERFVANPHTGTGARMYRTIEFGHD